MSNTTIEDRIEAVDILAVDYELRAVHPADIKIVSARGYGRILAALSFDRIDVGFRWTVRGDDNSPYLALWGPEGRLQLESPA